MGEIFYVMNTAELAIGRSLKPTPSNQKFLYKSINFNIPSPNMGMVVITDKFVHSTMKIRIKLSDIENENYKFYNVNLMKSGSK